MDNGKISLSSRLLVRHGLYRPGTHFSRVSCFWFPPARHRLRHWTRYFLHKFFPRRRAVLLAGHRQLVPYRKDLELTLANSRRQLTRRPLTAGPSYGLPSISLRSIFSENSAVSAFNFNLGLVIKTRKPWSGPRSALM